MRDEQAAFTVGPIVGVVVIVLAFIGLLAVCNDSDDNVGTFGRVQLAGHEYDGGCWEGECYSYDERSGGSGDRRGGDGRYAGGRSGDMEQGDGRNCRNFCDNVIYIPDPRGGEKERPT